jgi:cytidylate kinase
VVVAIDGPAGVGKSTVARRSAQEAGFLYVNSGNFYRAITLAVLESGSDLEDTTSVLEIARRCRLEIGPEGVELDGHLVEDRLHRDAVDRWVAPLSGIPEVREIVNRRIREIASRRDSVVEGRDIGTVVFPQADVKIFLDADVATRAGRRHVQGTSTLSREEIERTIRERDTLDRNKPGGRLAAAVDAVQIDTSLLTIKQVCERVRSAILVSKNNPGDIRGL